MIWPKLLKVVENIAKTLDLFAFILITQANE